MRSSAAASSSSALLVALAIAGCDVGSGTGSASGTVSAPGCFEGDFDLRPDFFAIDPTEDWVEIRVQRGSDYEDRSDLLTIFVRDADVVKAMRLGQPIAVDFDAADGVAMTLSLNDTCPVKDERRDTPVVYASIEGTIVFSALYVPSVDDDELETTATFWNVRFVDPNEPETRFAVLSGELSFLFARGRPAQRFP